MTSKSTTMPKKQSPQSSLDWTPAPYQKKVIKFALENSYAGLFLDPGLRKTSIILAVVKILKKEKKIDKVLIVAPLRVCYLVWPAEVQKWKDFNNLTISVLHGPQKEKALQTDADMYVINPEGLEWLFSHKDFKKKKFNMLVLDESTKFKSTNTQRFKRLRRVLPRFKRRYILTGTPFPNSYMDLFGQIYVLDLGESLGKFITHFRNKYFYPTGYGGYTWELQPGADKLIQDKIKDFTVRLEADDYIDLPKLIVNPVQVILPPDAQSIYEEMEDDLIASIKKKEVVASTAAVASGKCSQIANGGVYDEDSNTIHVHDAKVQAVQDIISELNGAPALVAYEFGHDLERLLRHFGKNTPVLGKGVSPKRSAEIERDWNRGKIPILLCNPASVGHGLNMQESGNHIIFHSIPWNYENYYQFIRRIRRSGAKHKSVFVHHIIAKNTIDEVKIMGLNRKFRNQKDFFEGLKDFLLGKEKSSLQSSKSSLIKVRLTPTAKETKMAKFAKKETTEKTVAPEKGKFTNDPELQDQDTGEATEKGKKFKKDVVEAKADKGKTKGGKEKPAKAKAPKEKAAATRSSLSEKKIKVLKKSHDAREGSKRAAWFDALLSSKTVGEAQDKVEGLNASVVRDAEKFGLIQLT